MRHGLRCVLYCVRYVVLCMGTVLCIFCRGMGRSVSHAPCCVLIVLCSVVCRAVWHVACHVLSCMMSCAVKCAMLCDVSRQCVVKHAIGIVGAFLRR